MDLWGCISSPFIICQLARQWEKGGRVVIQGLSVENLTQNISTVYSLEHFIYCTNKWIPHLSPRQIVVFEDKLSPAIVWHAYMNEGGRARWLPL